VNEERVPERLVGHGPGPRLRGRLLGVGRPPGHQPAQGQFLGRRLGQGVDGQFAPIDGRNRASPGASEGLQERARFCQLAPVRAEQEERGRVRRLEYIRQQGRAVDVPPLQIIDEHDERTAAEPGRQPAQAADGTTAQLTLVGRVSRSPSSDLPDKPGSDPGVPAV
jgi:hypothetical protein